MGPRDMSILRSIRRTMLGPYLGHIRAMFWLSLQYLCFDMTEVAQIPQERDMHILECLLFGTTFLGHVWAILGPCFGYFYYIFASKCLKWLKISPKSHACQIRYNL